MTRSWYRSLPSFCRQRRLALSIVTLLLILTSVVFPSVAIGWVFSGDVSVVINGIHVSSDWSTSPYINQNGRVMISIRSVTEALSNMGCTVTWSDQQFAAYIDCNDHWVRIGFHRVAGYTQGNATAIIDGREQELLTPPEMTRNRAFIGLRDLGDLLEFDVNWNDDVRVASINSESVPAVDREEYQRSAEWLEKYTNATLDEDDTVRYSLEIPTEVTVPMYVPAFHVAMYERGLERNHEMAELYQMYAYADPDPGTGVVPTGDPIAPSGERIEQLSDQMMVRPELASAQALAARRHAVATQARIQIAKTGGKVQANSDLLNGLTTYRTKDGILVRITPGGELHYLDPNQAADFSTKFQWTALVSGAGSLGGLAISTLAKAWPVGSTAAAFILGGTAAYASWMQIRINNYCARPGTSGAIIVKYWHLKVPDRLAQSTDVWIGAHLGFNTNVVERFLIAIPYNCDPWIAWGLK